MLKIFFCSLFYCREFFGLPFCSTAVTNKIFSTSSLFFLFDDTFLSFLSHSSLHPDLLYGSKNEGIKGTIESIARLLPSFLTIQPLQNTGTSLEFKIFTYTIDFEF